MREQLERGFWRTLSFSWKALCQSPLERHQLYSQGKEAQSSKRESSANLNERRSNADGLAWHQKAVRNKNCEQSAVYVLLLRQVLNTNYKKLKRRVIETESSRYAQQISILPAARLQTNRARQELESSLSSGKRQNMCSARSSKADSSALQKLKPWLCVANTLNNLLSLPAEGFYLGAHRTHNGCLSIHTLADKKRTWVASVRLLLDTCRTPLLLATKHYK